jgi:hypothetical protein
MSHPRYFVMLFSAGILLLASCHRNGPPTVIATPAEAILYSRDTTYDKAYQMHVTYNVGGSVDILRNEVGSVHAYSANEFILSGLQTLFNSTTAKVVLPLGQNYWLIPFQPGTPAIQLPPGDTLVYTISCTGPGGPGQFVLQGTAPQPVWLNVNPHGCASNAVQIATHSNTYSYIGGTAVVKATSVNIKK